MLYMVTPLSESDKTLERLNMFFVVILPYLMAVQSGRCSADATTMVILGIHLFSKFVPCRWWHCLSHVAIPTGLGNQLNLKPKRRKFPLLLPVILSLKHVIPPGLEYLCILHIQTILPNPRMSALRIFSCQCICVGLVRHRPGESQIEECGVDSSHIVLIGPVIGINTDHLLVPALSQR